MNLKHYELLADLFQYPESSFFKKAPEVLSFLKREYPSAAEEIQMFCNQLLNNDLNSVQELYTRSFDVQAITTLDVGYVLFGDDYKRGEILSHLNREHQKVHNDCGRELADHLPNLLNLMAKSQDSEFVGELIEEILFPALTKMINEFDSQRMAEKNKLYKKHYKTLIETSLNNAGIYQHSLKGLLIVIAQDFQIQEKNLNGLEHNNDFLKSLHTEMSVEKFANE